LLSEGASNSSAKEAKLTFLVITKDYQSSNCSRFLFVDNKKDIMLTKGLPEKEVIEDQSELTCFDGNYYSLSPKEEGYRSITKNYWLLVFSIVWVPEAFLGF
jgi:hypothetical protein